MSETALTPTQLVSDDGSAITQGAGTAINTSNHMTIPYPKDGHLLIVIDSDHGSTVGTVVAGFGVDSQSVAYAVASGVSELIVVGSSAKTKNSEGEIRIDWATDSAGWVRTFYLPASNQ